MDYKEKYEMGLEGIQEILGSGEDSIKMSRLQLRLQGIFPELKESEDERIQKSLIKAFGTIGKKDWGGLIVRDILAWLEKQGEQKNKINSCKFTCEDILALECSMKTAKITKGGDELYKILVPLYNKIHNAYLDELQGEQKLVDKVEPKFKVGDWIANDYCAGKVMALTDDAYLLDTGQGIPFSGHSTRLWDITKDAKAGDVLVDSLGNVCIYQEPSTKLMYHSYCYGSHKCFIDMGGSHEIVGSSPATKEQRDLLFSKMHEAGYEWDAEKKELKKIEQKPAWSEEDARICRAIICDIANDKSICKFEISKSICDEQINWLKSLKDRIGG